MARGITEQQVWEAADRLLRDGEQPTVERIRQHIGSGSPNTVGPMLKNWFSGLSKRLSHLGPDAVSAGAIPQDVITTMEALWVHAMNAARAATASEYSALQVTLDARNAELEARERALLSAQDRLSARESDLQAAIADATRQAAQAEGRLQAAEQQLAARDRALEEAISQERQTRLRSDETTAALQVALERHKMEIDDATARHIAHERKMLKELDEHRQALDECRRTASQQHHAAQKELAERNTTIVAAQGEIRSLSSQLKAASVSHARELDLLRKEQSEVLSGLVSREQETRQLLADARAQLELKDRQISSLTTALERALERPRAKKSEDPKPAL